MSSQRRIDQYFKSRSTSTSTTTGVKQQQLSVKISNVKPSFRNTFMITKTDEKKSLQSRGTSTKKFSDNVIFMKSVSRQSNISMSESQVNSSTTEPQLLNDSVSAIKPITPIKKTIRGFAMACNSPVLNLSREKISLKRQNRNSPKTPSPPKRSLMFSESIAQYSKKNSTEMSNFSNTGVSEKSLNLSVNFPDDTEAKIIVNIDEENSKSYLGETDIEVRERKFRISDISVESKRNETNVRNNVADYSDCSLNETKVTPKKGQMMDSSISKNSSSDWNVAVSIITPNRSMTELSSDWQKTLEETKERAKLSVEQRASKENVVASCENDISLNEGTSGCSKKNSPRRVLFPSQKSAKQARLAVHECPPSLSPQGILRSTDLRTNGNVSSTENINEPSNVKEDIVDTLKMSGESDGFVNFPEVFNENDKLITDNSKISNSQIKSNQVTKLSTNLNQTLDLTTKINQTSNLRITSDEIVISPNILYEIANSPKKINETSNTSTNINATSNSPKKSNKIESLSTKSNGIGDSPKKFNQMINSPTKLNQTTNSPSKSNVLFKTPTKSPSKGSKSSFSPRVKYSPQKVHKERVDTHLATRAVENLNQAKQGIIPLNDFDLESIYSKKSFNLEYGRLNVNTAIKYEAADVQVPEEKHADHFFMVLVNVFSKPLNCGYFDDVELNTVFSILTLSPDAQSLLARMLKRKRGWHRVNSIKYPEIAANLTPVFKQLVDREFLVDDIASDDILKSLSLLQVDEVRTVCQAMKVNHKGAKPTLISDLMKLSSRKNSLFPGMKSPSSALSEKVISMLGFCIRLPDIIENLLDRIFILLIPTQDPKENMAEAFRMLIQVHFGEKIFPTTPKERFPIFKNRSHLIRYAEARSAWNQIINASEAKDWDTVRMLGQKAYDNLKPHFENHNGNETGDLRLPSHVKRFEANYAWVKVMSKSVEGFKKTKENMATAAQFLHTLLSPSNKVPANRTRWYNELSMIESYHRKNFEISADITIKALTQPRLSEIDAAEILERARKLAKSKALSNNTKERINAAVSLRQDMFISMTEPKIKEIEATMVVGNTTGSKSTWSLNIGGANTGYAKVEDVALRHYLSEGYRGGIHCEGALPVTIFATLLWNEIYNVFVPGAFVSSYQDAPLDLYTSHFLEPRRELIEEKLKIIRRLDVEYLSGIMHEDLTKYRNYESLMHGNLFQDSEDFKDFIECLGIDAVAGIAERLAGNYNQWKSGFPDLALWNPDTKKCKIVEVKGPGDSLSTKQRLWIRFLECLGVDVEVCIVKGTTRRYAT